MQQVNDLASEWPKQNLQYTEGRANLPLSRSAEAQDNLRSRLTSEIIYLRRETAEMNRAFIPRDTSHIPMSFIPCPAAPSQEQRTAELLIPPLYSPTAPLPGELSQASSGATDTSSSVSIEEPPDEMTAQSSKSVRNEPIRIRLPQVNLAKSAGRTNRPENRGDYDQKRCLLRQRLRQMRRSSSDTPGLGPIPAKVSDHFRVMIDSGLGPDIVHLLFGVTTNRVRRCYKEAKNWVNGETIPKKSNVHFLAKSGERIRGYMLQQWILGHPETKDAVTRSILTGLGLDPNRVRADMHAWAIETDTRNKC